MNPTLVAALTPLEKRILIATKLDGWTEFPYTGTLRYGKAKEFCREYPDDIPLYEQDMKAIAKVLAHLSPTAYFHFKCALLRLIEPQAHWSDAFNVRGFLYPDPALAVDALLIQLVEEPVNKSDVLEARLKIRRDRRVEERLG